jgi:hypothetical protein
MTVALEIVNDKHMARASKDRTQLFVNRPEFVITTGTGKMILEWCNEGKENVVDSKEKEYALKEIEAKISACKTVEELLSLYRQQPPQRQIQYSSLFTKRRQELVATTPNQSNHISAHLKNYNNGTNNG